MQVRPYGDTANDGVVQLSFTLPLPLGSRAREAARRYAMLMGISNPYIAHPESVDTSFSFFVIKELGYDAGFGPGSTAITVASYIAQELVARRD
jgi:hypothetical protein